MATGQTLYSDVSSLIPQIYEGALFTLKQRNVLVPTVTVFNDTMGMSPRNVTKYGDANVRTAGEGDDVVSTNLSRSSLSTLTPARYVDQFFLSDQRMATDPQNVRADAALILGSAFAAFVDDDVADNFTSLTAGTVGTAGSTLTWTHILAARAILQGAKVPGPYWCALHPYQWHDLYLASAVSGAGFHNAPGFQDRLAGTYFVSDILGDVMFAITAGIDVNASDDAYGAMYSRLALAYDERKAFNIRPERDESREGVELNASMWYDTGVWDPTRGVQILSDCLTPT